MKIIFFGDIVGKSGREAVAKILPQWKKKYQPDLVLANGENLSHGKGLTKKSLEEILKAGVDLVTSGNHVWQNKEAQELLNNKEIPLLRPANYPVSVPGQGYRVIEIRTKKVLVINLIGRVFMRDQYDDPFKKADEILDEAEEKLDAIIVDWHAEATSEKKALGWYLDGRVSAVLGTHTHIPTADECILPGGTGYISDVGMVGPKDSVLGMDKQLVIKRFLTQMPQKFEPAEGAVEVDAIFLEIDNKSKTKKIERLYEIVG